MNVHEILSWEEVMPQAAKYYSEYKDAIVVFDLGGTYFRSGLYVVDEGLKEVRQQPALSFRSAPGMSAAELKQGLLRYLVNTARFYAEHFNTNRISISLGAALDGHRGVVYGSGPLWGDDTSSFDLLTLLRLAAPELTWHLVNDVTAALMHYVNQAIDASARKVLLTTISTGIACRVIDTRTQYIALDEFGLQGEIGHLPTNLCFKGQQLQLKCDCGGHNHLAAFASGRGVAELAVHLSELQPFLWKTSRVAELRTRGLAHDDALYQALNENDEFALNLLYLATQPVADMLRNALTLDPEIDRIVLTGGVVVNLATHYRAMLMRHFSEQGVYLSSHFDPTLFDDRLVIANSTEVNNLIGAALYAKNLTQGKYHA